MRTVIVAGALLALAGCDGGREPPAASTPDAGRPRRPRAVTPEPADRVVVRKAITYYRWTHTEPAPSPDGVGVDHGRAHLSLVVEVHRNPRNEGWVTVGALGAQVAIPENVRLRVDGATGEWHLPREGHNDPRAEIFGGEVRADEPVRVFLAAQPNEERTVTPGAAPVMTRLPVEGTLPATPQASTGQFDAIVIAVIPMRNRRGGRYLVQALDLRAEPGGFGANGVMSRAPTRAEIERYARWMRDPRGMNLGRPPPIPIAPIDRS